MNFTTTRQGLEDQLLAAGMTDDAIKVDNVIFVCVCMCVCVVVNKERPDLESSKSELTTQQNSFKIRLKELEDSLLSRLSAADGDFLSNYDLVNNLETTKRTAAEIEIKVKYTVGTRGVA